MKKIITDIAGKDYEAIVRPCVRSGEFIATTDDFDQQCKGKTEEEAAQNLLNLIDYSHPLQFSLQSEEKRKKVISWIQTNLSVGVRGNQKKYPSYHLKHVVEYGIGEYVGNGELKGALQQLGYPLAANHEENAFNWFFLLKRISEHEGE